MNMREHFVETLGIDVLTELKEENLDSLPNEETESQVENRKKTHSTTKILKIKTNKFTHYLKLPFL